MQTVHSPPDSGKPICVREAHWPMRGVHLAIYRLGPERYELVQWVADEQTILQRAEAQHTLDLIFEVRCERWETQLNSGNRTRQLIKPGTEVFFEYHCDESHQSSDAQLWYRSHQKVTVLHCDKDTIEQAENCGVFTLPARAEVGVPLVYTIEFADGHIGDAFEDELLTSEDSYERPAPPAARREPFDPPAEQQEGGGV